MAKVIQREKNRLDVQLRYVQGIAEIGNENQRLQYRVKSDGKWYAWEPVPIVRVDQIDS